MWGQRKYDIYPTSIWPWLKTRAPSRASDSTKVQLSLLLKDQAEEAKRRDLGVRWPTQSWDERRTLGLFWRAKDQLLLLRRRFHEYSISIPGPLGSRRRSPGHSPLSADLLLSDCGPCSPHFQSLITLCSLLFLPAEEPLSCQSDTN